MADRNVAATKEVQVSYKNTDDCQRNHIERAVEEFEDQYLLVDRNDTQMVEEMNVNRGHWDLAWNIENYNR